MTLSGIGALSVHSIMLQTLHVPFPDLSLVSAAWKLVIRAIAMLGIIFLGGFMSETLRGPFIRRWGALFLIDAMITETLFRGPFMDGYCTTAWVFSFVGNLPKIFTIAIGTAMAMFAALRLTHLWQRIIAAVAITSFTTYAAGPLIGVVMQPIMGFIADVAPKSEWCALPYGANVLIPAYLSYIEPAIACLAAAALVWNRLATSRAMRFLEFTLMILAVKNQLITPFVYAAFAKLDVVSAVISEGQFALEAATLALLTGITWEWASKRRDFPLRRDGVVG